MSEDAGRRGLLLAVFAVLTVHAVSLQAGFVDFDDDQVFLDNVLLQRSDLGVVAEVLSFERRDWRPLRDLSHWLDFLVHGQSPALAHLHNLLLLAAVVWLAGRFFGAPLAVVVLAFAHPVVVEPVAWVSGRKELLAGVFFFGTLLSFRRATTRDGSRVGWSAATFLCFVLAVMAKGHVLVAPLVLVLVAVHDRLRGEQVCQRTAGWNIAGVAVLALAAVPLVARGQVMLANAPAGPLPTLTWGDRLQIPLRALWHLVWPVDLNHIYLTAPLGPGHTAAAVGGATLCVVWLGVAIRLLRRRDPRGAWMLVPPVLLLPYLHLVAVGTVYTADRYLFLVVPFVFALVASALQRRGVVVLLFAGFLLLSGRQHVAWQDSVSLWTRMTEVYPQSAWGYERLGRALYVSRLYEEAAGAWMAASLRAPSDPQPLNNVAVALMAAGRGDMARSVLERVLTLAPDHSEARLNLRRLQASPLSDPPPSGRARE